MSGDPTPAHAPMVRRYAAWSLDAAAIALLTAAALHRPIATGLDACSRALDALTRAMVGGMQAAVDAGASPMALLQTSLADPTLHAAVLALAAALTRLLVLPMLAFAVLSLAWFAGFEGGRWQATPGKRLLGLQVIDDDGLPPRVLRAGLRQAAGLLSWLSLNLGHALAAVPPRHQALHDRIAGIRVVRTDARPLRPAVRLWLALQLPACFLLLALLMRAVDRSLTLALDASWPL